MSTFITSIEPVKSQGRLEEFNVFINKYIEGRRWLTEQAFRGMGVRQDIEDFAGLVIKPMQELWFGLSDQDKESVRYELCLAFFEGRIG